MTNLIKLSFVLIALSAGLFVGCVGNNLPKFDKEKADELQKKSESLLAFFKANPEIGNASIKDIRAAATGSNSKLDAGKSEKAITMIDDVIASATWPAFVGGGLKIMAVTGNFSKNELNQVAEQLPKPEESSGKKTPSQEGGEKGEAIPSPPRTSMRPAPIMEREGREDRPDEPKAEEKKKMTCEEVMDEPHRVFGLNKLDFEDQVEELNGQFKNRVSNCEKISGNNFGKCMDHLGKTSSVFNSDKINCNMKKFSDLNAEVEKTSGHSFTELLKKTMSCGKIFNACGFSGSVQKSLPSPRPGDEEGSKPTPSQEGERERANPVRGR